MYNPVIVYFCVSNKHRSGYHSSYRPRCILKSQKKLYLFYNKFRYLHTYFVIGENILTVGTFFQAIPILLLLVKIYLYIYIFYFSQAFEVRNLTLL